MAKYRSKGDLGARTEIERDNTEHILDQQSRVRVGDTKGGWAQGMRSVHPLRKMIRRGLVGDALFITVCFYHLPRSIALQV